MERPPLPPFTLEAAKQKVRMAEDAWNTRQQRVNGPRGGSGRMQQIGSADNAGRPHGSLR